MAAVEPLGYLTEDLIPRSDFQKSIDTLQMSVRVEGTLAV
jgi:hypothetical protein